jgi:pimeloyl-ACP methyl ester carboxylesterase
VDTAPPPRTLDEIRQEVLRRVGHIGPFVGVQREDVEGIVKSLTSLDPDHWAEQWMKVGLAHEAKGDQLAEGGAERVKLRDAYVLAFNYCRVGKYPCASTPGKREAYRHAVRLFRKAAKYFDLPLEVVEVPFKEGKNVVGYLQKPAGAARPPVAMHWGGVDVWKEDRQGINAVLHRLGLATLTVDMPGAGESPVRFLDPDAERSLTVMLDHLAGRKDVDGSRVTVWGGRFGGYWAARLAHTQAQRLRGAVFHGSNVHYGFQKDWLVPALTRTASTYLFGPASLLEARSHAMGVNSLEEFLAAAPRLSLQHLGLLDQPSAPLLCVNGKLDDQAPVQDIYLLLEHGSPKTARIYPQGGHMGRTPGRPEQEITETICNWLAQRLAN